MIQLSKEDGQKIFDFQERYAEMAVEASTNFFARLELDAVEQTLKETALKLIRENIDLNAEMIEKYGTEFRDLEIEQ